MTDWELKALDNEGRKGSQSVPILLLLMTEELGELTQAWLEATYEDGDPARVNEELDDLMALGHQLEWRLESEFNFPDLPRCGLCGFKIDHLRHEYEVNEDLGIVHDVCPIDR